MQIQVAADYNGCNKYMNDDNKSSNKENTKYRNSVFVDLFYEDETADANDIALYNALHQEKLPQDTKILRFRVDMEEFVSQIQNSTKSGVEN